MNIVSDCCQSSVVTGSTTEYPVGGTMGIAYKVDVCEECEQECGTVYACEHCGELECERSLVS